MNSPAHSGYPSLPPGPAQPAWDQAKAWIDRPISFWQECHSQFGDTFTVQLGSLGATVLFCDPLAVKEIFALRREQYTCGEYNAHYKLIMGDQSLLVTDGETHAHQRRLLTPSFPPTLVETTPSPIAPALAKCLGTWHVGDAISVRPFVHGLIFENILRLLFYDQHPELRHLLQNIFLKDLVKDYGTWSPWARFTKWHPLLRKTMGSEIQAARLPGANKVSRGMFDRLATHQQPDGAWLPNDQIVDHVFTMLIAGVDTTTLASSWLLYWVHATPGCLEKLREELLPLTTSTKEASHQQAAPTPWTDATIQESLRMVPVVTTPSGRRLCQETVIQGRAYPPSTTLLPCTYLVHHRPQLYPQPSEFRPERFQERSYRNYEFFPFGGGLRMCLGAKLAESSMKTILTTLIQRVQFEPAWEGDVVPVRHGTLLAPSENLALRVTKFVGS